MKGICFTEPLFHKVAKGEKTQTRRMINPEPIIKNDWFIRKIEGWKNSPFGVVSKYSDCEPERFEIMQLLKPKYKVGEIVYLKEPYAETCDEYGSPLIAYRFDNAAFYLIRKDENGDYYQLNTIKKPVSANWTLDNFPACGEWKNKLFMPQWAARYFIEITEIRAERLQDISDEDCIKEGIELYNNYDGTFGGHSAPTTPKEAYATLIDKISGKGTWERSPFVWVYDFRLMEK